MASLSTLTPDGHCMAVAHDAVVWLCERGSGPAVVVDLPDPAVGLVMSHGHLFAMTAGGMLVMANRSGRLELRRRVGTRGVGIGLHDDHVVAFTEEGWLRWRIDADRPDGRWGKERRTSVWGGIAGSCAPDGRVAVLTHLGELELFDERDRPQRRVDVEGTGVIYGGSGWFVVGNEQVTQVTPGGRVRPVVISEAPIRSLAASKDGRLLAIVMGEGQVGLWSLSHQCPVGSVQVLDRCITGVAFGPRGVLGIGLDLGDGNWIDLDREHLVRNQPPLGLVRRTWAVAVLPHRPLEPEIGEDDPTVEASAVLRRPRSLSPQLIGLVGLGLVGLMAGWMAGQAAMP